MPGPFDATSETTNLRDGKGFGHACHAGCITAIVCYSVKPSVTCLLNDTAQGLPSAASLPLPMAVPLTICASATISSSLSFVLTQFGQQ